MLTFTGHIVSCTKIYELYVVMVDGAAGHKNAFLFKIKFHKVKKTLHEVGLTYQMNLRLQLIVVYVRVCGVVCIPRSCINGS